MRDDSAEILFESFLQEAIVSSSGTDRDVHSLMLSIQRWNKAIQQLQRQRSKILQFSARRSRTFNVPKQGGDRGREVGGRDERNESPVKLVLKHFGVGLSIFVF